MSDFDLDDSQELLDELLGESPALDAAPAATGTLEPHRSDLAASRTQ